MSCWDSFLSFHLDFGAGANMDKLWYLKFEPPPNSWIGRSWGATWCHTKPTSLRRAWLGWGRCLFGTTQVQKAGRLRRFRDQRLFLKKDWPRMSTPQRYPTWIMKSCLYEILGLYVYSPHKWIHIPPVFLSTGAFQSWILNHFKTIPGGSSTSNSCPKGWFWANLHITAHFSRREAFFAQLPHSHPTCPSSPGFHWLLLTEHPMPPSNHSNKTVPNGFVCLPMASVSGMSPLHNSQSHETDEDHHRQPNRYCRTFCHGTCESPRFLLRTFHTNSNLPSVQGPLQHVKMQQLARIHGHPGARKISDFQNTCAESWIPRAREQHFLSHLGKYWKFLEYQIIT